MSTISRNWHLSIFGIIVFYFIFCLPIFAQDSKEIQEIRRQYIAVNQDIELCKQLEDEPCNLYKNTLSTNTQDKPWAAVGTYQSVIDFWYKNVPNDGPPKYGLFKVNAKTLRSARTEFEEYLFDLNGNLIFYFFKLDGDGNAENQQEYRFYFQAEKLIEYKENIGNEEEEYQIYSNTDAKTILEKAADLQLVFRTIR